MLGSTHDEMYAFLAGVPEITGATGAQVEAVFRRELGDKWLDGLNFCRNRRPGAGPLELLSLCLNETNFAGRHLTHSSSADFGRVGWQRRYPMPWDGGHEQTD